MLNLKNATKKLEDAKAELEAAYKDVAAAEERVDQAKKVVQKASDDLYKSQWASVPCPRCGAKRYVNCRVSSVDLERRRGINVAVLHSERVALSGAGRTS